MNLPGLPSHLLHTYQSPAPGAALQTFGDHGAAPYGYALGSTPDLYVPHPQAAPGPQPVYHLKVTATPVELPEVLPPEGPQYVVTAHPTIPRSTETALSKAGETVIAHATPTADQIQSISIRPANLEAARERELAQKTSYEERLAQRSISMRQLSSRRLEGAAKDKGDAYVHIYTGRGAADMRDILQQSIPAPAQLAFASPARAIEPMERALSQMMPIPLEAEAAGDEERSKMYSWIIPSAEASVEPTIATSAGAEAHEQVSAAEHPPPPNLERLFAQASAELTAERYSVMEQRAQEEQASGTAAVTAKILSTPTDDELGLPNELRPSIIYGGVEHAPPEFAGTKGPLKYRLHAVEVHQYVPLPESKEPWLIQSNMDPATTAIFGPMPMPFDPAHSGMVAPTFQKTMGFHPVPMLSPELSRMFNHELPIVSNLLDVVPPAEA